MASKLGDRWSRCVILAIITLMSIAQVDCNQKEKAKTPTPTPSPTPSELAAGAQGTLVIEDNSLASWIAINNTFADSGQGNYWAGLLVQVGDFPTPSPPLPRTFKRLVLSKGANEVKVVPRATGKVFWVNIISESSQGAPMAPEKVAALYPSGYGNGQCAAPAGFDQKCLRGQKIHSQMNPVLGVLTYWQGPNGYTVTAKQPAARKTSTFTFQLLDKFKIDVYEIASDGTVTIQTSFNAGDIDKIAISPSDSSAAVVPPSDGDKQDPPWPGK